MHPLNEDFAPERKGALNFTLVAARYRLGLLTSDELPGLAMAALEAGFESRALCELACERHPTFAEHQQIFERALRDCGVSMPETDVAVEYMLRHYLQSIASGGMSPQEGMRRVVTDIYYPYISDHPVREYVGDQRGLEHLIGAFYAYDDLYERPGQVSFEGLYGPKAVPAFDRHLRQLAEEWLQRNGRNE
jgi:hypothetical protein